MIATPNHHQKTTVLDCFFIDLGKSLCKIKSYLKNIMEARNIIVPLVMLSSVFTLDAHAKVNTITSHTHEKITLVGSIESMNIVVSKLKEFVITFYKEQKKFKNGVPVQSVEDLKNNLYLLLKKDIVGLQNHESVNEFLEQLRNYFEKNELYFSFVLFPVQDNTYMVDLTLHGIEKIETHSFDQEYEMLLSIMLTLFKRNFNDEIESFKKYFNTYRRNTTYTVTYLNEELIPSFRRFLGINTHRLGLTEGGGRVLIYPQEAHKHKTLLNSYTLALSEQEILALTKKNEKAHKLFWAVIPKKYRQMVSDSGYSIDELSELHSFVFEFQDVIDRDQILAIFISIFDNGSPAYQFSQFIFKHFIFRAIRSNNLPPIAQKEAPIFYLQRVLETQEGTDAILDVIKNVEDYVNQEIFSFSVFLYFQKQIPVNK